MALVQTPAVGRRAAGEPGRHAGLRGRRGRLAVAESGVPPAGHRRGQRRRGPKAARRGRQGTGRAEENYRKARKVVDDFFTRVSEEKLLDGRPGRQPLRKDLAGIGPESITMPS